MSSTLWRVALLILAAIALVGGGFGVQSYAINRLLQFDAANAAVSWTDFLGRNTADLRNLAEGQPASAETRIFVGKVRGMARVFLYKIYDVNGIARFVSDDLHDDDLNDDEGNGPSPSVLEAIATRGPVVEVKAGTPPDRPAYYSEAYIPVFAEGGRIVAVVETYIDQTTKQTEFQRILFVAALAIAGLLALALGVPGIAWYWRSREHDRAGERLRFLTDYDALSRLPNRRRLGESLTRLLAESTPTGNLIGVFCIDLDRFKDINDALGQSVGDAVLSISADRLRALAGPIDLVARLGGDEFVLVQRAPRDHLAIDDLAAKISHALSRPITIASSDIMPSVSIGIALAPDHGNDADELIRNAEVALVRAKAEGRSKIWTYTDALGEDMRARRATEEAVNRALASDGFELHYQPLYAIADERLIGFEALARLPDGRGGYIPPDVFIAAAERMGAIHLVGAWVMKSACATATTWPENLTVSVNLSVAQFAASNVTTMVKAALINSGLAPKRLLIEITESVLADDARSVLEALRKLKALGIRVVMDDFGTGYSSLSYLWQFPFDKIKIDGSFMRTFDANDEAAQKIVETITALGHALGMRVCVEGVETERHVERARRAGCDEAQGYYFGRPAPVAEVATMIMEDFQRSQTQPAANAARVASSA